MDEVVGEERREDRPLGWEGADGVDELNGRGCLENDRGDGGMGCFGNGSVSVELSLLADDDLCWATGEASASVASLLSSGDKLPLWVFSS